MHNRRYYNILKRPIGITSTYRAKHSRYCYQQKNTYIVAHFPAERKEFMTELDLYLQCIPLIAEMVIICQKLPIQQYEEWKRETMETAPESVKGFLVKVFIVISVELERIGRRKAVRHEY